MQKRKERTDKINLTAKDFKLADHYSKLDTEYQKELSEKIMRFINTKRSNQLDADNVLEFARYSSLD